MATAVEKDPIDTAYEVKITKLFDVFVDSYLIAQDDEAKGEAEKKFQHAGRTAKQLRERAKALIA